MAQKFIRAAFVSVALFVLLPLPALAQTPFAPPPQIPYGLSVSTESAKHAAAAAIAAAQKNHWKMAIAIVDTGGYLVYFEKMQDTQTGSVDLAIEKARTAALFRRPTKVFQDGVAAGGEGEEKVTYATRGHTWEIYGHWTDNPDELRTDVFYLLK